MRIPSQFNDQTLYGRRGRQPQSSQSYRRLIRLVVALTLVVVVMQQAGDVALYETFFGDRAGNSPGGGNTTATALASRHNEGGQPNAATEDSGVANSIGNASIDTNPVFTAEARATATEIAGALDINSQRQWTVVLDQWQAGDEVNVIESMVQSLIDVVKQFDGIDDEQRFAWAETIDRFGKQHASADEIFQAILTKPKDHSEVSDSASGQTSDLASLTPADKARLTALLWSLDQAAVDRVVDGTIWRSADFDAFYRQLDQAPELSQSGAIKVSVVPLMQQPKTYLGQRVLVDGKVARATKKEAAANPFGVDEYWEIWLRPSTGGDRPFVVIAPAVPDSVGKLDGQANVYRGPAIKIIGRFFKRLAYGSQVGADAAPVVVGRIQGLQSSENPTPNVTAIASPARTSDLRWVIALSILTGISIAVLVMWRTKVLAQRSRELRQASRPATDLSFVESDVSTP
jgi:hypothetical protein